MAERSKACDSSESLPALAGFSSGYPGVGSNPTLVNFRFHPTHDIELDRRIHYRESDTITWQPLHVTYIAYYVL